MTHSHTPIESNLIEWPQNVFYADFDRSVLESIPHEQRMKLITMRTRFNAEQLGVKLDCSQSEIPFTSRARLAPGITSI